MKAHYDKDTDILMLLLSNEKVDDSYETKSSIVSVNKEGEPVTIEIFQASKFLKDLSKIVPKNLLFS